jgi:hypothetical protein
VEGVALFLPGVFSQTSPELKEIKEVMERQRA